MIQGAIIGIILTSIFFVSANYFGIYGSLPSEGSFKAAAFCETLQKEDKLDSKYVPTWVAKPILDKFNEELSYMPEIAREQVQSDAERYIEILESGVVTERVVTNLAYLIEKATPSK